MARLPIKDEIRKMRDEMNQIVNELFNNDRTGSETTGLQRPQGQYRRPVTELKEKDDEYLVTAELPGVDKDNIKLEAEDNTITIQVDEANSDDSDNVRTKTRRSFYKQFTVPRDATTSEATASYSNGVLEVRLPREANNSNTIRIE